MTSSAQSRSSAAAGTILAKGKNRQGPQQQIWLTFGRCCCTASPVHCTALGEALAPQVDAVCGNSAIGAGHVDRPTMVAALGRGPGLFQGTLLSATEKDVLNICYIRNVSLGFDLRIIGMVARLGKSDWRGEDALVQGEWGSNHPTARRESRVSLVGAGL